MLVLVACLSIHYDTCGVGALGEGGDLGKRVTLFKYRCPGAQLITLEKLNPHDHGMSSGGTVQLYSVQLPYLGTAARVFDFCKSGMQTHTSGTQVARPAYLTAMLETDLRC